MKFFHLISPEEAEQALSLSNAMFQKAYARPPQCAYVGALDRLFGCPALFKSDWTRTNIDIKCATCTCHINNHKNLTT